MYIYIYLSIFATVYCPDCMQLYVLFIIVVVVVVVVVLLFYVHGKHPRSCRDGQLT